jgi:hypothetical protein
VNSHDYCTVSGWASRRATVLKLIREFLPLRYPVSDPSCTRSNYCVSLYWSTAVLYAQERSIPISTFTYNVHYVYCARSQTRSQMMINMIGRDVSLKTIIGSTYCSAEYEATECTVQVRATVPTLAWVPCTCTGVIPNKFR